MEMYLVIVAIVIVSCITTQSHSDNADDCQLHVVRAV